ncbi:MAG TPA: bifunctional phosphopantothenoylcysteine decarboxylase/phosphopantothenate--cysteine ligase CoaBC [Acidimicrobiales bacterium]|nr:bifunctional phosphopantothenoylcysteine decarboxylase/phosphopantothenate--cysteine ligase CoaBC [Acidimicrobiales bacterium]
MSRSSLEGATVVLGVSGGIAAYKAVEVARRLVDAGAHVVPVATRSALRMIGQPTLSALASEPVHHSLFEDGDPIPHTTLGRRADFVLVVPATARLIGAYAAGISSDLLVATLLATRSPVLLCPAMHTEMWEHPAVQENLATLRRRGVHVLAPDEGRLAGGDVGAGRLPEPARIVEEAAALLAARPAGRRAAGGDLEGLRVLVTAGGTREPIDPVRFIGNRSSGKQGYAVAEAAAERGAAVTLVSTVGLPPPAGATVVRVETAAEMAEAVLGLAPSHDVVVMAAAVADFRPVLPAPEKLKKLGGPPSLVLEPTVDILAELGRRRRAGQVLVGFAAETGPVAAAAAAKLADKRADVLVGNDVAAEGAGFEGDTNAVTIVTRTGSVELPLTSKRAVADALLDTVIAQRGREPGAERGAAARDGDDGQGAGST